MVRDDTARTVLFDLDQAVQAHAGQHGLDHPLTVQLTGVYHNMVRLWADT
jgi:PKHD-type hydroxylase